MATQKSGRVGGNAKAEKKLPSDRILKRNGEVLCFIAGTVYSGRLRMVHFLNAKLDVVASVFASARSREVIVVQATSVDSDSGICTAVVHTGSGLVAVSWYESGYANEPFSVVAFPTDIRPD